MRTRKFLLLICCIITAHSWAQPITKEINTGWKFKQASASNWYPSTVPGVVHTDLMQNGIIEDPFLKLNEKAVQWVDKEDWIYETTFDLNDTVFSKKNIILHCKGLDTYADVYLNDSLIIEADNMFRQWTADIKNIVLPKKNRLKIYFRSPIKEDLPKWEALPFQYKAVNDQSENGGISDRKLSVFARKAGYHYGWDWGPRLVTSGIWRPVTIEAWNDAKIEDIFIEQNNVSAKNADIKFNIKINADTSLSHVILVVKNNTDGKVLGTVKADLQKGENNLVCSFNIKDPKLWWSNGLGEPHLYTFKTELLANNKTVIDTEIKKAGIRSLKVIHQPDQYGESFYFELNGVPVFAKGANYIPNDNFLPRVTHEKYERTIQDVVNANMNTLRVWGGGVYEDDYFYDLCDRYGIMVWQDFMFACSLYPAEGKLLNNIQEEAIDNITRLHNHPSIALWCGNNECLEGWFGWGWKKQYSDQNPEYEKLIWKQYENLFHKLLPELVTKYAPQSFYWPSSPFARYDGTGSDRAGDLHYWSVWHGRKPVSDYNHQRARFFSEYGFQSFPEFESVKLYAPEKNDWDISSEVMMSHQRGGSFANGLIEDYLLREYRKPKDFESFLYLNLVLQGNAIKTAIEAHRRDMPYCMGSLFWQVNDCWPVASWSSRDYYGRWKAEHYFAREANKDMLVSPLANDSSLTIHIVSDRSTKTAGKLKILVFNFTGSLINVVEQKLTIPSNASTLVYDDAIEKIIHNASKKDVVINTTFTDTNGKVYTNNYFLAEQKDLNLPETNINYDIKPITDGFELTLSSAAFARAVFLSIQGIDNFFEDNYFDLLPHQRKIIKVKTSLTLNEFKKQLKIRSMRDAY